MTKSRSSFTYLLVLQTTTTAHNGAEVYDQMLFLLTDILPCSCCETSESDVVFSGTRHC